MRGPVSSSFTHIFIAMVIIVRTIRLSLWTAYWMRRWMKNQGVEGFNRNTTAPHNLNPVREHSFQQSYQIIIPVFYLGTLQKKRGAIIINNCMIICGVRPAFPIVIGYSFLQWPISSVHSKMCSGFAFVSYTLFHPSFHKLIFSPSASIQSSKVTCCPEIQSLTSHYLSAMKDKTVPCCRPIHTAQNSWPVHSF